MPESPFCPADIILPEGWDWPRVERERVKWDIGSSMVPCATAPGVVAWCTINAARAEQAEQALLAIEAFDLPSKCTGECAAVAHGKQWVMTGEKYGGDVSSFNGEGRCYCMFCGEDGDA